MKRTLALLFAVLMLTAAFAGCAAKPSPTPAPTVAATETPTATPSPTPEPTPTPAPEVTDFLGYTVKLGKIPERIVSLSPSNTEIVYALGLGSKLVGVDAFSDFPEEAKAIAKVGDFNGPNLETIASLKPDLVLCSNKLQQEIIDQLKGLNLVAVAVEATAYADVYRSIEMVGKLTGTEAKAAEVVAQMQAKEKAVLDAVATAASGKTVYFAMSYGEMGNWTGGPGSFPYEFIEKCGGKNITEGLPVPWVNFSMEELVAKNPDIILLSSDVGDPGKFKAADGYKGLKAVKDGKVFVVTSNLCSRPGPRMTDGLREFAQNITGLTIKFPGE